MIIDLVIFLFNILFSIVGWFSSLMSFNYDKLPTAVKTIAIVFIILLSILYVLLQYYEYQKKSKNIFTHKTNTEVNNYLLNWLREGGNTVIFTRNLSWADESIDVFNELYKKATSNSLTICLSQNTETTFKLQRAGARIIVHGLEDNQIKSRFTIIDYGTSNPRITVGTKHNGEYVNERFDMRSSPKVCNAYLELVQATQMRNNTISHRDKSDVNQYLLNWLNQGGNSVIFTRNLSWADESIEILRTLEKKACEHSLTICLSHNTDTTRRLEQLGAKIITHGLEENEIKSRFIIVDYGRVNPKVTVGTKNSTGEFINEWYDMRTNPSVCNAFIEVYKLTCANSSLAFHSNTSMSTVR